jgi:hypothetical protein
MVSCQDPEKRKGLARQWFSNFIRLVEVSYKLTPEEHEKFANDEVFRKELVDKTFEQAAQVLRKNNSGLMSVVKYDDDSHALALEFNYLASKMSEVKS